MIMRCKKRFRANLLRICDIFQHRPRDGKPIKGACSSPDFIQNQQTFVRCVMQNIRNLCHFYHKRALPCGKVIGVQVARLAGLPNKVIRRSGQILKQLNAADITKKAKQIAVESKEQQEETAQQMDMFHIAETQLADEISKLDVMAMTPIEALQTLFELQKKAKGL